MNKEYTAINFADVILLKTFTIVMPLLCALTEANLNTEPMSVALLGKWFIFWIGLRIALTAVKSIRSCNRADIMALAQILLFVVSVISCRISSIRVVTGIALLVYFCFLVGRRAIKGVGNVNGWLAFATDMLTLSLLLFYVVTRSENNVE